MIVWKRIDCNYRLHGKNHGKNILVDTTKLTCWHKFNIYN